MRGDEIIKSAEARLQAMGMFHTTAMRNSALTSLLLFFLEHMLQRVEPIFADLHAELGNVALPIRDERDQAFTEHRIIPFAEERVVLPMFQRARHGLMRLQLDVKPGAFYAQSGSP